VAAGTGVAPCRAFLSERSQSSSIGHPIRDILFIFGCLHPGEGQISRKALKEPENGILKSKLRIMAAFSRVQV
jgi:NADPH-ferrihemoprotein reductase